MQPCTPHSSHTSAHIMHTSYLRYSRDYLRLSEIPHLCVVVRGGVYVCVCVCVMCASCVCDVCVLRVIVLRVIDSACTHPIPLHLLYLP